MRSHPAVRRLFDLIHDGMPFAGWMVMPRSWFGMLLILWMKCSTEALWCLKSENLEAGECG
jgi:hypothetical protein